MKRSILGISLILTGIFSSKGQDSKQHISCIETTIIDGYFLKTLSPSKKNVDDNEFDVWRKHYFVTLSEANSLTIDAIYHKKKYSFSDSVKFLSYTPIVRQDLDGDFFLNQDCKNMVSSGVNIDSLINPQYFYGIKNRRKWDRNTKVGFVYTKIKWLHLKISNFLALTYFDKPYTLKHHPKFKEYDIYIPLQIIKIDKNIIIKKRKIKRI